MKSLFIFILVMLIVHGCSNSPGNAANDNKQDSAIAKNYFPVNDFIKNEIAYADSFFATFIKYTVTGNKTDSSYIQPAAFKQLAVEFTDDELSKESLEKDYTETSFLDQTSGSATFTYSTLNSTLAIQRVDVLATPGEGFDKISSIYIEKITLQGDTSTRKKMYWKAGKSFQVITERVVNKQPPQINHYKIVWDAQ